VAGQPKDAAHVGVERRGMNGDWLYPGLAAVAGSAENKRAAAFLPAGKIETISKWAGRDVRHQCRQLKAWRWSTRVIDKKRHRKGPQDQRLTSASVSWATTTACWEYVRDSHQRAVPERFNAGNAKEAGELMR